MAKLDQRTLKLHLKNLSREELLDEIGMLFDKFTTVKEYYQTRLGAEDSHGVLEKYKAIIEKEFNPPRGLPKARLSVAKKAISDFKKISDSPVDLADLMVAYVEAGVGFTREFGDIDVPLKWAGNPKLAMWVNHQRGRDKEGILSGEQKRLLDELGFTWKMRNRGRWEDRLEEVAAFKAKYGHCDIPTHYPENPKLGRFVNNTRSQRNSGRLSADRITKLDVLGFV